ncbi:MAG: hypothetical protein AB1659_03335 [Thermodesulfobacteriota bacterium]
MQTIIQLPSILDLFSTRVEDLFSKMDHAYHRIASHYGFICNGCSDNCCFTRFYHHTFTEYLMIYLGYQKLESQLRDEIKRKSTVSSHHTNSSFICPLNIDGRCILYPNRPMICRLHGIPHELHTPGRPPYHGSGCDFFTQSFGHKESIRFDRTPFYMEMARIENELKTALELQGKLKLTIAEMILEF